MPTPPQIVNHPSTHVSERGKAPIEFICLHHTAGTDSLDYLTANSEGVSTHVLISKAGTIFRMVPDEKGANTVGHSNVGRYTTAKGDAGSANQISLNAELENTGSGRDPYPDAQRDACAWQIATWWRRFGILPVLPHKLIDTHQKTDPAGLDMLDVLRRAIAWYDLLAPTAPRRYSPDSPLMAAPWLAPADVYARFPAPAGGYTVSDIRRSILPVYWKLCTQVGLDPVIAIAQMAHETGWLTSFWAQRPQRNPAGIGVTGDWRPLSDPQPYPPELWRINTDRKRWEYGISFLTWAGDSIPAHVGRLLAYALPAGEGTLEQQLLITRALAIRPLPASYRGYAPTLAGLEGTWADPGELYADSLARIANELAGV
jgi:hypothetical protein